MKEFILWECSKAEFIRSGLVHQSKYKAKIWKENGWVYGEKNYGMLGMQQKEMRIDER